MATGTPDRPSFDHSVADLTTPDPSAPGSRGAGAALLRLGRTRAVAWRGVGGHLVDVEVAGDGLVWPARQLTAATDPYQRTDLESLDLAVACAVLVAAGSPAPPEATVLLGALGHHGTLRPVRAVLPRLLAARRAGIRRALVPTSCLAEASAVPGLEVVAIDSLGDLDRFLAGQTDPDQDGLTRAGPAGAAVPEPAARRPTGVVSAAAARDAELVTAGGHHALITGRHPAARRAVAARVRALLPDLDAAEAVDLAAIRPAAGRLPRYGPLLTAQPPFVEPHHSVSATSLLGGGRTTRPGAVSLAQHGVLFLSDIGSWHPHHLDELRTVLTHRTVRCPGPDPVEYPADRSILLMAGAPCACADFPDRATGCICDPAAAGSFCSRLGRPLRGVADLHIRCDPDPDPGTRPRSAGRVEGSRARVLRARAAAADRWGSRGWLTNAQVPATVILRAPFAPPTPLLDRVAANPALTRDSGAGLARLGWTFADLAGLDQPDRHCLDQALALVLARST